MSSLYNTYLNTLSTEVGTAARSLYEQVCSDVNTKQLLNMSMNMLNVRHYFLHIIMN